MVTENNQMLVAMFFSWGLQFSFQLSDGTTTDVLRLIGEKENIVCPCQVSIFISKV
jgi:hypothetical protein